MRRKPCKGNGLLVSKGLLVQALASLFGQQSKSEPTVSSEKMSAAHNFKRRSLLANREN
jgi:hypothetical protein